MGRRWEGTKAHCQGRPLRFKCLRKPCASVFGQVTFFDGSKTQDLHPQTTAMKGRIDRREGRLLYSGRPGIIEAVFGNLHNHHLRRFTLRTRGRVDAQWKLFALCTSYKSCEARRLEASGKARSGGLSSNPAMVSPKQVRPWSGPMIILRSNNAASEPIGACARFGDSVRRLFLQPCWGVSCAN